MEKKIIDLTKKERKEICQNSMECTYCKLKNSIWNILGILNCYYYDKKDLERKLNEKIDICIEKK